MAKREMIGELAEKIDQDVVISGWIKNSRDHGKVIFWDVRDTSGVMQVVIYKKDLIELVKGFREEFLVTIAGKIQKRPDNLVNAELANGNLELASESISLISSCEVPPFEIHNSTNGVNEETRLKYRYLDLRTARMARNIKTRHQFNLFIRNYLSKKTFTEIETPILTKGTPEGAREFIVPSRLSKGSFFVLPQSPQQYKQLLMVAGFEKYFQLARCFRDEDQRGDRQPEFTQLDIEMSFVEEEDVLALTEQMMVEIVKELFPEKKISNKPFPRIEYTEAIKKYKTDKPDLRKNKDDKNELAFAWIIDFPLFEKTENSKGLTSSHHPFTRPRGSDMALLEKEPAKVRASAYDLVLNGFEIGGGSIRIHEEDLQKKIFKILGISDEEVNSRFGHLLRAFEYSPPPHGGIALGIDRVLSILLEEPNIREVIAFPKTGDAKDPMTGAPTPLPDMLLREAGVKLAEVKKK